MSNGDRWLRVGTVAAVILIIVSDVIPVLYTIGLSLIKDGGRAGGAYATVIRDPRFLRSLVNTAFFCVGTASLQVVAGVALGRAMRHLSRGRQVAWFTVLLTPWLMSEAASVVLWRGVLMADVGHLDRLMRVLGLPSLGLLAGSATALPALVLVATWQGVGFATLVTLGVLSAIPQNLYRASLVCGLTPWKTFLGLELPLLRRAAAALWVAVALHSVGQFALPARLTMGGPLHATTMVSLFLFDGLLNDPSPARAAAGGCVILAGMAVLVVLGWAGVRRATAIS